MATKNKNNNGNKKDDKYDGIKIMFQAMGEDLGVRVEVAGNRPFDLFSTLGERLQDCLSEFMEFHKKHPGITEMHFLTKPTEWEC